jgi:hypothetical protein
MLRLGVHIARQHAAPTAAITHRQPEFGTGFHRRLVLERGTHQTA